ncbi:MAG: GGDEF domain-containing protein [Methylococcaceae bacterium]|nr:MAG: GGDEF domain-containing protein [Methylococcaceae bacterium]
MKSDGPHFRFREKWRRYRLLPETDSEQAFNVIERLREAIAASEVALEEGLTLHFSASLGVATFIPADADINTLLNRADQALYQAKCSGRNRTCKG